MENNDSYIKRAYKDGLDALSRHFWMLAKMGIILTIATIVVVLLSSVGNDNALNRDWEVGANVLAAIAGLLSLFVLLPLTGGMTLGFIKARRDESFSVETIFVGFKKAKAYFSLILSAIIVAIIVAIGLVFLIVPGVIFAMRLLFFMHFIMDKNCGPFGAIGKSWKLTKGHVWNLFLATLLQIVVGSFVYSAAIASYYNRLLAEKEGPQDSGSSVASSTQ